MTTPAKWWRLDRTAEGTVQVRVKPGNGGRRIIEPIDTNYKDFETIFAEVKRSLLSKDAVFTDDELLYALRVAL